MFLKIEQANVIIKIYMNIEPISKIIFYACTKIEQVKCKIDFYLFKNYTSIVRK